MQNRNTIYFSLIVGLLTYSCRTHKPASVNRTDIESTVIEINETPTNTIIDSIEPYDIENRYEAFKKPLIDSVKNQYELAYAELESMLSKPNQLDFKRAVFITENAYFNGHLNYDDFLSSIAFYQSICENLYDVNLLNDYPYSDSINLKKNFAIYTIMKDTTVINEIHFLPLGYDFENNSGESEWSTTFVTYLLKQGKGNCHSLPYLYKILANETDTEAYLSLAPNHLYLKHRSKRLGWYNTELTSGQFPTDAWVKASGYITIDAIRSGIYMDTLGQDQSVALCAYDLAMGYSKKTGKSLDGFVIKCCDLALKYHPQNINAIILKAETLKKNYEFYIQANDQKNANECFSKMKELYVLGVNLGYREMPKEMYLAWLQSSVQANEKYNNQSINKTLNQDSK